MYVAVWWCKFFKCGLKNLGLGSLFFCYVKCIKIYRKGSIDPGIKVFVIWLTFICISTGQVREVYDLNHYRNFYNRHCVIRVNWMEYPVTWKKLFVFFFCFRYLRFLFRCFGRRYKINCGFVFGRDYSSAKNSFFVF